MTDAAAPPHGGRDEIARTVHRNLEALVEFRDHVERGKTVHERVADFVAAYAGSMGFVYVHALVVLVWLVWNSGHLSLPAWDPYPFTVLAVAASVEAIFLTSMVLVSQNRLARLADRRADLARANQPAYRTRAHPAARVDLGDGSQNGCGGAVGRLRVPARRRPQGNPRPD